MAHARGRIVGYLDGDAGWEADPAHLRAIVDAVATDGADCACAQRDQTHWTPLRRFFRRGSSPAAIVRLRRMVGSSPIARWATFDCYGTLIDWNAGIGQELERLFGAQSVPRLLPAYHEIEPQVQREDPRRSYREVLDLTLVRLADREGFRFNPREHGALARSLPGWPLFPEVRPALEVARARGWRLAILSNTDRDLIEASMQRIGVRFEFAIVASELGSYKPSPLHWETFCARSAAERDRYVHVGASPYHDIAPAVALGIPTVWVNRLGETAQPKPTVELPDLIALADTLDGLVAV